jgi:hypothetical protein
MTRLLTLDEFVKQQNVPEGASWTEKEQVEAYQAYLQISSQRDRNIGDLASLLRDIVRVSLKASPEEVEFGHPCSGLIDWTMSSGIKAIAENLVDKPGEYRLNGAGLKLYTSISRGKLSVVISGDQFSKYPKTGSAIKELIKERGF